MASPRVLIVFFTRSGNTERVAFEVARDVGKLGIACDVEPLAERVRRRHGLVGFVRSARDALLARPADLRPLRRAPSAYDLVIVGTPIWATSVSTPVRTFLTAHRTEIKRLAVFLTFGGAGKRRVFRQMSHIATRAAVATLAIRERDLVCEIHHSDVKQFVVSIANVVGVLPRVVATPRPTFVQSAIAQ